MKLLISLLLVIILCIINKICLASYAKGFTLFFLICTFCFQGVYFYFSPLKFLNVGLLMLTFLYWKQQQGKNEMLPVEIKYLFYAYFILQIFILFSSFFNGGTELNIQIYNFIKSTYLKFGLAFLAFFTIKQIKDIERFNKWLIITVILVCIYSIIEYFTHINIYADIMSNAFPDMQDIIIGFYENERGILTGRIGGTLIHALNLGQMLIVFFGYLAIIRKQIGLRNFYILSTFIFITIIFTGSRSCIFPAVLLFGSCIIIDIKLNAHFLTIISIISISLFFTSNNITLSEEAQETINSFLFFWDENKAGESLGGSSVNLREQQWQMVLYIIEKNTIIFGQGFGYMNTNDYVQFKEIMKGAESILFTYTIEQGILGFTAFVILLIIIGKIMGKYSKRLYGKQEILIYVFIMTYLMSLFLTGDRLTSYAFFVLVSVYIKSNIIQCNIENMSRTNIKIIK